MTTLSEHTGKTIHPRWRYPVWGLGWLVLLLLLGRCVVPEPWPTPTPTPAYAPHRVAMHPEQRDDLMLPQLAYAPQYNLDVQIDTGQRVLTGTATITVTNRTNTAWTTLALRLYPNLPHYAGAMRLRSLHVGGQPVAFSLNASATAALVDLRDPIPPNRSAQIEVIYTVTYHPVHTPTYLLFGEQDGIVNLPLAYPALAVPEPDGGWRLDDGIPLGDTLTAESSFFRARVTVPTTMTLISSAVIVDRMPLTTTEQVQYELVSGPARELILLLGPDYQQLETTVGGVRVRSFYRKGDEAAGRAALTYAIGALQVYSRRFGPYPFAKLDVATAMLLNRGMEYPTLNLLGIALYRDQRPKLEFLVAHEVAHQWWYNLVGNDQIREPWLDEGLTEYSTYFYYQDVYGTERAETLRLHRWETPYKYVRQRGLDAPIGLPATAYSQENYETIIYAKGALFFHELRTQLGDETFLAVLRSYRERFRYRLATAQDFQRVAEAVSQRDLSSLFDRWVYGSPSTTEP